MAMMASNVACAAEPLAPWTVRGQHPIMRSTTTCYVLSLVLTALAPAALEARPVAGAAPPRQVNITTDSEPGWIPDEALMLEVARVTALYFSALDKGAYRQAYDLMSDANKAMLPFARFEQQSRQFYAKAGRLLGRESLKVTWTKGSRSAPDLGIYVAIDVGARFEGIDRQCGFLILHQPPAGNAFEVARVENNFIDNATAQSIERNQSRAALDQIWAQLSANCPNFTGAPSG